MTEPTAEATDEALNELVDMDRTLTLAVWVRTVREASLCDPMWGPGTVYGKPQIEGRRYVVYASRPDVFPGQGLELSTEYPFTMAAQIRTENGIVREARTEPLDALTTARLKAGRFSVRPDGADDGGAE